MHQRDGKRIPKLNEPEYQRRKCSCLKSNPIEFMGWYFFENLQRQLPDKGTQAQSQDYIYG